MTDASDESIGTPERLRAAMPTVRRRPDGSWDFWDVEDDLDDDERNQDWAAELVEAHLALLADKAMVGAVGEVLGAAAAAAADEGHRGYSVGFWFTLYFADEVRRMTRLRPPPEEPTC